jgi:hypothetical protein
VRGTSLRLTIVIVCGSGVSSRSIQITRSLGLTIRGPGDQRVVSEIRWFGSNSGPPAVRTTFAAAAGVAPIATPAARAASAAAARRRVLVFLMSPPDAWGAILARVMADAKNATQRTWIVPLAAGE